MHKYLRVRGFPDVSTHVRLDKCTAMLSRASFTTPLLTDFLPPVVSPVFRSNIPPAHIKVYCEHPVPESSPAFEYCVGLTHVVPVGVQAATGGGIRIHPDLSYRWKTYRYRPTQASFFPFIKSFWDSFIPSVVDDILCIRMHHVCGLRVITHVSSCTMYGTVLEPTSQDGVTSQTVPTTVLFTYFSRRT